MFDLLVHWLLDAAIILAVAHLVPGIRVRDFRTSMVVALVLGILSLLLKYPLAVVLTVISSVLTLPLVVLTVGLWSLLLYFIMTFIAMLLLLRLTATLVSGFTIYDGKALVIGALLISLFHSLVYRIF